MKNLAIIYHWWSYKNVEVIKDLSNPIIFSIATVRHFHKHLPIYVLDVSDGDNDWGDYPFLLNFFVIKKNSYFKNILGFKTKKISRIWDISNFANEIREENIIFSDCDIFWVNKIFPLLGLNNDPNLDKFHCNKNNGIFYYRKNSHNSKEVYRLWKKTVVDCIESIEFFNSYRKRIGWGQHTYLHDELIIRTVMEDYPDLFVPVDGCENNIIYSNRSCEIKNIHAIKKFTGDQRGKILGLIKELREIIKPLNINFPLKPIPYADIFSTKGIEYFSEELRGGLPHTPEIHIKLVRSYILENIKLC